eukprot:scaffold2709_cov215-Skeletonema_marinoi.AAC.2
MHFALVVAVPQVKVFSFYHRRRKQLKMVKNHDEAQAAYGDKDVVGVAVNLSPEHMRGATTADDAESQPLQEDVIDTTAAKDTSPSPSPSPADVSASPNSTDNNQGETDDQLSSIKNTPKKYRNINSYYGHKIGFYQTLSLLLNAGLMLYAHLGLSAVIYSSRDPSITALDSAALGGDTDEGGTDTNNMTNSTAATIMCNEQDIDLWTESGGESNRPTQSNYCSRTYTDSSNKFCLVTASCISECFQSTYGYSETCSSCFAAIPTCSMRNLCTFLCAADSFSVECQECNAPCVDEFNLCSGLPTVEESGGGTEGDGNAITTLPPPSSSSTITQNNQDTCNRYDLSEINEWYTAYELTFVRSIKDAWNGDAQLLAIIVILFSGIWPYAKNIILVIVWYTPMSIKRQSEIILWLSRLSKYTLVDVFAVITLLTGVQLQLNVGGTDAVIRAEPRFGIIAFFVATLWEFLQIELIKVMYEKKVVGGENTSDESDGRNCKEGEGSEGGRLLFKQLWIPIFIYIASLALYISGAVTELMFFENSDIGSPGVCIRSFNLATLGNALVSPSSLTDNSAAGWSRSMKLKRMIKWTSAIWCFACIEVLLIGVFAVEFKFPQLVGKLAGDTNAGFLEVKSGLGIGFYILIAYSVVAGFLQWSLIVRYDEKKQLLAESVAEMENDV